jgi:hypothetical protein
MKISSIQIENFKRIRRLDVSPGVHLFVVGGKNGNGKSSLLDAVEAAFGGKRALPARALRDGADEGEIKITLDSGHVIRCDLKGGVTVGKDVDGKLAKLTSPQALLSAMAGSLAMDPLAFMRQDAKSQQQTIRELTGCDASQIEAEGKQAMEDRKQAKKVVDSLDAQIAATPVDEDAPAEPVDTAALAAELAAETKKTDAKRRAESEAERARQDADRAESKVEAARAALAKSIADAEKAVEIAFQATRHASELPAGDTSGITERLAGASAHNARHEAAKKRAALVEKRRAAWSEADNLDALVKAKREEYRAKVASAQMPVEGLSFGADGLTFGGVPLAQASSAEQLRVSLAVASALAPQLRTVLVREGSLLDEDSLEAVAEFCVANDLQVIMERVSVGDECTIVMHDGRISDAR